MKAAVAIPAAAGIFAAVCQNGGVLTSPRPTSSTGASPPWGRMESSTCDAAKAVERARISEWILS